ncbi:MAG: glycosyltransferase [Bacteroidales bacterium]|nr:glycosyltransferase [Clostridium sp.]MCM1203838.1 glycosyltransferase [Bacteroidales bacterium]
MTGKYTYRILVARVESQYNALSVFEEELIRNWEDMGMVVGRLEDYSEAGLKKAAEQEYDFIFVMNGAIFSLGRVVENYFPIPVYAYYVDHPLHVDSRLRGFEGQHCILSDSDFKDYVDRHYHLLHETEVVMQAGIEGRYSKRPFKERKYPVVFCGSYRDYHALLDKIDAYEKSFRIFLRYMVDEALRNPVLTMEEVFNRALEQFRLPLSEEEYTEFLFECREVEMYLRGYYRAMAVKQIVESGIPVEVYGDGWEKLDCSRKDLLHCHAPIDYREMPDVFADAQIVINVMPWAKAGFHDRIACAMLNGALVISDETAYMREQQLDGEKLALYSLNTLADLPQKAAYYLEHLDEAEKIARNGYEWAKENHTWRARAEQLRRLFERGESQIIKNGGKQAMSEEKAVFDVVAEMNSVFELWQKYLPVMLRFQEIGIGKVDKAFLLDFVNQVEELAQYSAELKNSCCNGGGMIWIETAMIKALSALIQCVQQGRTEDAAVPFAELIVDVKKEIAQLQEWTALDLYDVNCGKMKYKADNKKKLLTVGDVANALDSESMNPLEHFFFLESHNKMGKWSHYFEVYHRHFERFRNRPVTVLEIGIWGGGSLQMWKNYFGPQSHIIGIDIMEECRNYEEEQIKIYIGSQEDREFLQRVKKEIPQVDIIIDDGGHTMNQQIVTFEELFPILAEGGVYLCEDMHTSYWPEFKGGYKNPHSFAEYSKNFVDALNARYSLSADLQPDILTQTIQSIHYYDSMIVLEKGEHKMSVPFWI